MQLWIGTLFCFPYGHYGPITPREDILGFQPLWLHVLQPREKGCPAACFAHTSCGGTQLRFLRATESQNEIQGAFCDPNRSDSLIICKSMVI